MTIESKWMVALTSSTTWTIVALFVYNALNANLAVLPPTWSGIVSGILGLLALYLHSSHVVAAATYGTTHV